MRLKAGTLDGGRGAVGRRVWPVVVVVLVWEAVTRVSGDRDFPPPSEIAARMRELWFSGPASRAFLSDAAVANLLPSLARMLGGWGLAVVAGVPAGVALGRCRPLADLVQPLVQFGRVIPPPLLLPFFLLVFRAGTAGQLAAIAFGAVWPVLLNSMDGARSVERGHLDTAAVFHLTGGERLRLVVIPSALPKIVAGLRLSLSLALIMMVISEVFGGADGIGYQLLYASRSFDTTGVWAAVALLGVLGYALNGLLLLAGRRHTPAVSRA